MTILAHFDGGPLNGTSKLIEFTETYNLISYRSRYQFTYTPFKRNGNYFNYRVANKEDRWHGENPGPGLWVDEWEDVE